MYIIYIFFICFVIQLLIIYLKTTDFPMGKYLVIGNCSSCYPQNAHDIVKSFDGTVIVFNNNKTFVHCSKNIVMVNSNALITERLFGITRKKEDFAKVPTVLLNDHMYIVSFHVFLSWMVLSLSGINTHIVSAFNNHISNKHILTTGLRIITTLLENSNNTVYYFGFQHTDTSQTAGKTLYNKWHNGDYENRVLKKLRRTKRLIKIR